MRSVVGAVPLVVGGVHDQKGQHGCTAFCPACGRAAGNMHDDAHTEDTEHEMDTHIPALRKRGEYLREKELGISAWKSLKPSAP